jgi:uncharacterized protein
VGCHISPSGQSIWILNYLRHVPLPSLQFTITVASFRSIAATATFSVTASLTARLFHGALEPIPGDPSLGIHGSAFLTSSIAALASTLAVSRMIHTGAYARQAVAFCTAFAFAFALRLSNLSDQRRVLAFLLTPAHRAFDSSLVYLAIGAVPLSSVLYHVGKARIPNKGRVDPWLLAGAALFGIGWGIEGICRESVARLLSHYLTLLLDSC